MAKRNSISFSSHSCESGSETAAHRDSSDLCIKLHWKGAVTKKDPNGPFSPSTGSGVKPLLKLFSQFPYPSKGERRLASQFHVSSFRLLARVNTAGTNDFRCDVATLHFSTSSLRINSKFQIPPFNKLRVGISYQ